MKSRSSAARAEKTGVAGNSPAAPFSYRAMCRRFPDATWVVAYRAGEALGPRGVPSQLCAKFAGVDLEAALLGWARAVHQQAARDRRLALAGRQDPGAENARIRIVQEAEAEARRWALEFWRAEMRRRGWLYRRPTLVELREVDDAGAK